MPGPYKYKQVTPTFTASKEVVASIITSTAEEPKHIDALKFSAYDSTTNAPADALAYIEREKILDIPLEHLAKDVAVAEAADTPSEWVEIDTPLPVGQSLSVGYRFGSVESTLHKVTVKYHIVA